MDDVYYQRDMHMFLLPRPSDRRDHEVFPRLECNTRSILILTKQP